MADLTCEECANTDPARFIGHIDPNVYDGVLVWECQECGRIWPRFVDDPESSRRTQASIRLSRTLVLFREAALGEDTFGS